MRWPLVKLHSVCRPKQWKTIAASNLLSSGYPVYGANGKIGFYSEYTHEYPTLMITCRGATCGNVHISEPKSYINGNAMALDELDAKMVDIKYLYYFLVKRGFDDVISGSAQPQITGQGLTKVEIPLPPLTEQKRIAAILDKADAIRRKRQQAIHLADEFLRSVFLDMFGDPVSNPKGWDVMPLGKVAIFENGDRSSNYPSGEDIVSNGVLFLSTKNIVLDSLNLELCQYITEEKFNSLSRGKAVRGDLIITLRGTLGSCCIFDCEQEKAFINAQMMIIRPNEALNRVFLQNLLTSKAMKAHLQGIGHGAAVPQLTARQLKELLLPIPDKALQDKYETIRNAVLTCSENMLSATQKGLFESIVQKAFSGGHGHDR